jgi:hypothetical protein
MPRLGLIYPLATACDTALQVCKASAVWGGRKIVFVDTPAYHIGIDANVAANLRRKVEKWQKKT